MYDVSLVMRQLRLQHVTADLKYLAAAAAAACVARQGKCCLSTFHTTPKLITFSLTCIFLLFCEVSLGGISIPGFRATA
jgi:hypothetical protein